MKKGLMLAAFYVPLICVSAQTAQRWVVAKDESGKYKTVQSALDAVPINNKRPITIRIKNGIYKEKLHLDSSKNFVTIIGEDKFNTILTYDDHSGKTSPHGDTIRTGTSYTFVVAANNFKAENLTIRNDAGYNAGQAVGLEVRGDKALVKNCRVIGDQDVLYTSGTNSKQYYENCYIEGTTDFIFGAATVWFEKCHIHSKKNSFITAASTPLEHEFGYVFNDCMLTADTAVGKVFLGRPWRPYASTIFIHCYFDKHILPEGWSNWNTTDNYKTTRYAEYKNYGPGSSTSKRVSWGKQLTDEDVLRYQPANVLGDWFGKTLGR